MLFWTARRIVTTDTPWHECTKECLLSLTAYSPTVPLLEGQSWFLVQNFLLSLFFFTLSCFFVTVLLCTILPLKHRRGRAWAALITCGYWWRIQCPLCPGMQVENDEKEARISVLSGFLECSTNGSITIAAIIRIHIIQILQRITLYLPMKASVNHPAMPNGMS